MKYKAIVYDIDGTLLDTIAMNMYPLMKVIKEETGIQRSFEDVKQYFSMTGKQTMEALGFDYEKVYPRWVQYVNEYEKGAEPFQGVKELLEKIQAKGVLQAAVSAKTKAQYDIDMQSEQLYLYMDDTVLFEDTTKHKPDPEPLLLSAQHLDLKPEEVLYVGDALADGLAAQNAGMDFAWAKWAGIEVKDMPQPTYLLLEPNDLFEALFNE